jgi:hypothetical protein
MRKATYWQALAGVALVVAGCGKSSGGGRVSREALPSQLAGAQCESLAGCCRQIDQAFDVATCKTYVTARLEDFLSRESGVNTRYDAEAAGDCLADYSAQLACGQVPDDPPACRRLYVGTLPLGAACVSSSECAPPEGGYAFCYEVCTAVMPLLHGKLGDPCSFSCGDVEDCEDMPVALATTPSVACYRSEGLYCPYASVPGASMTCQPLQALGQACMTDRDCVAGAACAVASGTCIVLRKLGERCDSFFECESVYCEGACVSAPSRPTFSAEECSLD